MQELSIIEPVLVAAFIGGVGALGGGVLLLFGKRVPQNLIHVLVSFAAGALIASAFFDLLPEAIEHAEELSIETGMEINIFYWTLFGVISFYFLERAIHWFRYHQKIHKGKHGSVSIPLVVLGDSVHNFIDGVAIGITYLINPALGVTTTIAIIAHEIPQEIGDFAVLLHEGLSRKKVLIINVLSALLAVFGAILALAVGEQIEGILPFALSLTAGFFIYLALTNLLPEIHSEEKVGYTFWESGFFMLGIFVIWAVITFLPHGH